MVARLVIECACIRRLESGVLMHVIPVLDLKDGVVVLASGGRRDDYRPVDTALCRDPSPPSVINALLDVHSFEKIYIADLDAIAMGTPAAALVVALTQLHPAVEFWLDAGFSAVDQFAQFEAVTNLRFVIGSESLSSIENYQRMRDDPRLSGHILSLDRKEGRELGPRHLIRRPDLWPDTVISMDLTRIGGSTGPNLDRIGEIRAQRADLNVVAAGGVRGFDDLRQLAAHGVSHALVASALHNQNLLGPDLERLLEM